MTDGGRRVLLLAGVLGVLAQLPLGPWRAVWFVLKPNRLVAGEVFSPAAASEPLTYVLLGSWLLLLVVALLPMRARFAAAPLAAAVSLLVLYLCGLGATVLIAGQPSSARVSLGIGFWLAVVACYVAWFGAAQLSAGSRARLLAPAAAVTLAGVIYLVAAGHMSDLGLAREFASQGTDFRAELARHLALSGTSLLVGTAIGLPLAVLAHRRARTAAWVLPTVAFFQTVPSLALFGVLLAPLARLGQQVSLGTTLLLGLLLLPLALLPWLWRPLRGLVIALAAVPALLYLTVISTMLAGVFAALLAGNASAPFGGGGPRLSEPLSTLGVRGIGAAPALIALTLYTLLPIVRNTYEGLRAVPDAAVQAGRGMGMGPRQLLLRVELPLALPLMFEGLRAAAVLTMGITTVAYLIGAGGLGVFIQRGIDQVVSDLVLLGALPVIALALMADGLLRGLSLLLMAPPLRHGARHAA